MKKSPSKLPEYQECLDAIENGTVTALQRFIYENEPSGTEATKVFRGMLADVIEAERSQPSSRPDERDVVILKMREILEFGKAEMSAVVSYAKNYNKKTKRTLEYDSYECHKRGLRFGAKIEEALALPIPASTKKMEAMQRAIEAAKNYCAVRICNHWPPYDQEEHKKSCMHPLTKALSDLEALGAEEL